MYRQRPSSNKRFGETGGGIKHENIDRQILVLHKAMAEKLLLCPELVESVKEKVETRYQIGKLGYGGYLTWMSILEIHDQPEAFMEAILEDTFQMRRLRRHTPLVGILTEQERQATLEKHACGEMPTVLPG